MKTTTTTTSTKWTRSSTVSASGRKTITYKTTGSKIRVEVRPSTGFIGVIGGTGVILAQGFSTVRAARKYAAEVIKEKARLQTYDAGNGIRCTVPEDDDVSDDMNPAFILQGTKAELLVKVANGDIDLNELARKELANRGLNRSGEWVGFKSAEAIFNA